MEHDGVTVYEVLRSDPPLLLRPSADRLLLVGGAAGPLGGDQLRLVVTVGRGASLHIASVAASMALPGPEPSCLEVDVTLGAAASLTWAPQPLITLAGSRHRQRISIRMAADARLRWRESLVLGRSDEPPGGLELALRVERDERVVLHQELDLGWPDVAAGAPPGWADPAVLAGAGAMVTDLVVGPPGEASPSGGSRVALADRGAAPRAASVSELGDGARQGLSLGPDLQTATEQLAAVATGLLGPPP